MRLAVIGGGIAGLAAAYEARQLDAGAEITVFEAAERVGGKLGTTPFAGRVLDESADAFLVRVPWAVELCDELGLTAELTSPATGSAFVFSRGELRRLPSTTLLGIPTDLDDLAASRIVSNDGISRARADLDRDDAPLEGDVSVGAFVRDRLGDEVLERVVEPLIGGINAGRADGLSLRACAAQIAAAADRGGSLIRAARELRAAVAAPGGEAPTVFAAPIEGMGALVERLAAATGAELRTRTPVTDLRRDGAHWLVDAEAFDRVVVATPAPAAATLLAASNRDAAAMLSGIGYASVVLVSLAFDRAAIDHPLDGSGLLVPEPEGLLVTACSFASTKWRHHARPDDVVFRVSVGRWGDERPAGLDDDALVGAILADLDRLVGVGGAPSAVRINRWPQSLPQYRPGHLDRVDALEALVAEELPGLALAGASLRGLGVPACIQSGRVAARRLQ